MNQPIPTGPDLFAFAEASFSRARSAGSEPDLPIFGSEKELYHFRAADFHARQAQTAAIVMLTEVIADKANVFHCDLPGWREKIGATWLRECRGREIRRPQCEERHTEDCDYTDPPKESRHELLPVGTRSVKQEPTGPRLYVQNRDGKQGHVVEVSSMNGTLMFRVQWYMPGVEPVWKAANNLTIIPAKDVERCPNGQTGDECGSGENQCELCLQAEDAEAEDIERSMGLQ